MKIFGYYNIFDGDTYLGSYDIIFSKKFIKTLNDSIVKILKKELGDIFSKEDLKLFLASKENITNDNLYSAEVEFLYYSHYAHSFKLFWKSNLKNADLSYNSENLPDDTHFWVEDLYFESLKNDLIKLAPLKKKKIITKYKFPIIIKLPQVDNQIMLHYGEAVSEKVIDRLSFLLSNSMVTINDKSTEGIIHSISELTFKKNIIEFKIDLGSAGEEELLELFADIDKSELVVEKIEIKGI